MVEDDLESLEGDIGEGYRRPLSDSDEDEKDKRKVNAARTTWPSVASPTHMPRLHGIFPCTVFVRLISSRLFDIPCLLHCPIFWLR